MTDDKEKKELTPAVRIEKILEIKPIDEERKEKLTQFLEQPLPKIAEAITGAFAVGSSGVISAGARVVQGALKGNFFKQFAREVNKLVEAGKIPEDYAEEKYAFKTLAELLKFIDEEDVDDDRLLAITAMFYAVNKNVDQSEGEQLLNYQLFKLCKKITASQLLLLRISHRFLLEKKYPHSSTISSADAWLQDISGAMGHAVLTLIRQDEHVLIDLGLLTKRAYNDGSGVTPMNARLTDLGIALCERLLEYDQVLESI